jgi:hypothetical protein
MPRCIGGVAPPPLLAPTPPGEIARIAERFVMMAETVLTLLRVFLADRTVRTEEVHTVCAQIVLTGPNRGTVSRQADDGMDSSC